MLDPLAIINQAKEGTVPAAWRVLRPRGIFPISVALVSIFFTFAVEFMFLVVSMLLHFFTGFTVGNASGAAFSVNPIDALTSTYPVSVTQFVFIGLGIMALVAILTFLRLSAQMPYSYFVFTPEGAVQATGPNAITAIDYTQLDSINTRVQVTNYVTTNASTGARSTNTTVSVWLELHYRDGRTQNWRPAGRFASAESIGQRLIDGLQHYKQLVGALARP